MPKKKSSKPEEPAKNQELVRRVDSMMSTELPDDAPPKPVKAGKVIKPEVPTGPPLVTTPADEDKPPEEPAAETQATEPEPAADAKDPLEDNATDKAVDDIVAHEGDTVLAVNDALTARKQATAEPGQPSGPRASHKWFWIIILIVLLGTAADAAIYLLRR